MDPNEAPGRPVGSADPAGATPSAAGRRRSPRRGGPFRALAVYGFLLGAAFLVGILLFNMVIMPAFVRRGDEVRVPDVSGKEMSAAEELLTKAGLKIGETRTRHDKRPVGTVVKQQPGPGTAVKEGRTVILTLSSGEPGRQVPSLSGETVRNAELALGDIDLKLGQVMTAPAEGVPPDLVVASQPPPGTTLPRGSRVDILVSAGGAASSPGYLMPDLRGRETRSVRDRLESAGFEVRIDEPVYSFFRAGKGRVRDQDPPPGARVMPWDTITLRSE